MQTTMKIDRTPTRKNQIAALLKSALLALAGLLTASEATRRNLHRDPRHRANLAHPRLRR